MFTVLPPTDKKYRASKRNLRQDSVRGHGFYSRLLSDVTDFFLLATKELNSNLSTAKASWNSSRIKQIAGRIPREKLTKDERVAWFRYSLDIGALNTMKVCRHFILAALPNLRNSLQSWKRQLPAMKRVDDMYRYYEIL